MADERQGGPKRQGAVRVERVTHQGRQLSMRFTLDGLRFATTYWYGDVDVDALAARLGSARWDALAFHIAAFEATKLTSLGAETIDFGPYEELRTEAFDALFSTVVRRVFAQWRYEHGRPEYLGPALGPRAASPAAERAPDAALSHVTPGDVATLAFCGGGKDSLVAIRLLERAGEPFGTYAYAHSVYGPAPLQHALIDRLLDTGGGAGRASRRHRQWVTDDFLSSPVVELAPEYGSRSLLAAETPSSIFGVLPVVLTHGYSRIVLAHERSANFGNLVWPATGEEVNHQWGKSYEAERLLSAYVREWLVPELETTSLLQPLYDVVIFELLRRDANALPRTHSCNLRKPWCLRCPKCAYVALSCMAHLPADAVRSTFAENVLDLPENALAFRQMLGLAEHTPFECVGTVGEARLAFALARAHGWRGAAMDGFESAFLDAGGALAIDLGEVIERTTTVGDETFSIPRDLAARVLPEMKDAAASARARIRASLGAS